MAARGSTCRTDEAPTLADLAAASVRGVAALGARVGVPVRRWGDASHLARRQLLLPVVLPHFGMLPSQQALFNARSEPSAP